jgi:cytochrome c
MKRYIIIILAISIFTACGGGGSKEKNSEKETEDVSKDPDYQKGLALVAKSDCLTCHKVDEVITGPTYRDVANKYGNYPDTIISHLAGKIITGGTGVWGTLFMTAHPNLSQADAEAMVKYILLLKNK